jgi:hypothetical protein
VLEIGRNSVMPSISPSSSAASRSDMERNPGIGVGKRPVYARRARPKISTQNGAVAASSHRFGEICGGNRLLAQ